MFVNILESKARFGGETQISKHTWKWSSSSKEEEYGRR